MAQVREKFYPNIPNNQQAWDDVRRLLTMRSAIGDIGVPPESRWKESEYYIAAMQRDWEHIPACVRQTLYYQHQWRSGGRDFIFELDPRLNPHFRLSADVNYYGEGREIASIRAYVQRPYPQSGIMHEIFHLFDLGWHETEGGAEKTFILSQSPMFLKLVDLLKEEYEENIKQGIWQAGPIQLVDQLYHQGYYKDAYYPRETEYFAHGGTFFRTSTTRDGYVHRFDQSYTTAQEKEQGFMRISGVDGPERLTTKDERMIAFTKKALIEHSLAWLQTHRDEIETVSGQLFTIDMRGAQAPIADAILQNLPDELTSHYSKGI